MGDLERTKVILLPHQLTLIQGTDMSIFRVIEWTLENKTLRKGKQGIGMVVVMKRKITSEMMTTIHPKRWFPRFQESADNFEFSAERLSENAQSIKITLFAELLTAISLLNLSIKRLKHTICSTKMPL